MTSIENIYKECTTPSKGGEENTITARIIYNTTPYHPYHSILRYIRTSCLKKMRKKHLDGFLSGKDKIKEALKKR